MSPSLLVVAAVVWAGAWPVVQPGTIVVDTQEWRSEPLRHFYIHGTLNGDTAFRLLLPVKDQWRQRLVQYLQGGLGGDENAGSMAGHDRYALANGAVYVESSQGHAGTAVFEEDDTPEEIAYEASYAVAMYAQARCVELLGGSVQYAYVFGDSGGGHRASGLIERFPELYDGAIPCVGAGSLRVPWYLFSIYEQCRPVLLSHKELLAQASTAANVTDFLSMVDGPAQRALRRLLFAGFPAPVLDTIRADATSLLILDYTKYKLDPGYFRDFWATPGYAGHDGKVVEPLVEGVQGIVVDVDAGKRRVGVTLESALDAPYGMTLAFSSGALQGEWRRVYGRQGQYLQIGPAGPGVEGATAGDQVLLDNRDLIAFRYLHEYLRDLEDPALAGLPEERGEAPAPQRTPQMVPGIFEPDRPLGRIRGKMIAVYGSHDPLVWPSNAFTYARHVRNALGDSAQEHFRLHFVENGVHHPIAPQEPARFVGRVSLMHKALDDLMAWVERGVAPPQGTSFEVDDLNQLKLAMSAEERGGYQPVVVLSVGGGRLKHSARLGETVRFSVEAEGPDNDLAQCEIDFEGDGTYDVAQKATGKKGRFEFSHAYREAGDHWAVARVTDVTTSAGGMGPGIQNLSRVQISVTPN